jgi:uncharacterized membrane protein YraQ (UPF0718 family)
METTATASADGTPLAPLLGIASLVLLVASFRWAHHWGPLADSLVAGWIVATLAALVVSLNTRAPGPGRRAALFGLALVGLSFLTLIVTGIAMAAGADPAGACGGG